MYDCFLGGHHNFPVDRAAAERVIAAFPDMPIVAQANRAFLRRAERFLLAQGVDQRVPSDARLVYADVDPVAVSHSRSPLAGKTPERLQQAWNVWNNTERAVRGAFARGDLTVAGRPGSGRARAGVCAAVVP
jgi:S-adenosyl methyltransferase